MKGEWKNIMIPVKIKYFKYIYGISVYLFITFYNSYFFTRITW